MRPPNTAEPQQELTLTYSQQRTLHILSDFTHAAYKINTLHKKLLQVEQQPCKWASTTNSVAPHRSRGLWHNTPKHNTRQSLTDLGPLVHMAETPPTQQRLSPAWQALFHRPRKYSGGLQRWLSSLMRPHTAIPSRLSSRLSRPHSQCTNTH